MRKNKKKRTEAKRRRLVNKKLIKKYPWLKPYNVWTGKIWKDYNYETTWADDIPKGWRKAFGDMMFEEIDEVLKRTNTTIYIEQIKEKYGCYDKETQVLTKSGWKYFDDITDQDKIATLNEKTGCLEYHQSIDKIKYKYKGKMYYLENRGINLCVTPNHNLYVSKGSYFNGSKNNEKRTYDYELTTPDKYFGKDKRFKKGCNWIGTVPNEIFTIKGYKHTREYRSREYILKDININIHSFLKFLGAYIADGCASPKGDIMLAFNPYNFKKDVFKQIIEDIGYTPKEDGNRVYRFSSKLLAEWLLENCGHGAYNKKVPNFIKELSSEYIKEFLTYLYYGDGSKQKTSYILTTVSPKLAEDVEELLIKCGNCFRETIRDRRGRHQFEDHYIINNFKTFEINWLKNNEIEIDNSKTKQTKSFKEEWIDYDDYVYCLTVPNHIMYVKRHGKGVWCGNSLRFYCQAHQEIQEIIDNYSKLSENICIVCGKPDVSMLDTGWMSPVCKECFERNQKTNKWAPQKKYEEYVISDNQMAIERRWRRYSPGGETKDYCIDISDKAEKIRAKYRNSHK